MCFWSEMMRKSILPTFYKELLFEQIPKAQKDTDDLTVFKCWRNRHLVCVEVFDVWGLEEFDVDVMGPDVNFINVLRTHFLYKILAPKITKLCFAFEIFWRQNIAEKNVPEMWMKLTPDDEHAIDVECHPHEIAESGEDHFQVNTKIHNS